MRWTLLPSRSLSWRRRVLEYALVLPVIYAIWLGALYTLQDRFIYPRSLAGPGRPAGSLPRGVESIWIDAGTTEHPLRIEAWYLPPTRVDPAGKSPAVIFFHGNAELVDGRVEDMSEYRKRGYAVLLPEYRGYGRSAGTPCEPDIVADACRFYDILAARPEIDPARIVLHGRSLGGGVACQVAAARPALALILESTFTSAASFCWRMGAPPLLCSSPFRNDRVLPHLDRPVLILHGADDDIISVSHAHRLHAITPGSAFVELPGHHNDFPLDTAAYWAAIDVFLSSHGLPAAAPE